MSQEELDELVLKASLKLEAMNDRHPSMVWYSEAKFLYSLLPEMLALVEELAPTDSIAFISFLKKIVGENE